MLLRLQRVYFIISVGLFLRAGVSAWNGLYGPSYGADSDALRFHSAAVSYSSHLVLNKFIIGYIYSYVMGVVYFLVTPSLLLGCLLSTMMWGWSAYILWRIMRLLSFEKTNRYRVLWLYALWPSSIFLTSVTLREAYELFFVNLAVYSAVKIYSHKSFGSWLLLALAVAGMGALHGVLFPLGLFVLIALLFLVVLRGWRGLSWQRLFFLMLLAALIGFGGVSLFNAVCYNLSDGLDVVLKGFQADALSVHARAQYKTTVEINGFVDGVWFIGISFFQYLFEPMPWRVIAPLDLLAIGENLLRAWLIWKSCAGLHRVAAQTNKLAWLIFLSYVLTEMIWSLGTINWGTAMRHHIPSMGLLLLSAFVCSGRERRVIQKTSNNGVS